MTTATLEPTSALPVATPAPAATGQVTASTDGPARGSVFMSKAVKVTGYCRVGFGPLAAGTFDGVPARLVLPLERIAAADLRLRTGGTKLTVSVDGTHPTGPLAVQVAEAAVRACGIDAGEVTIALRPPIGASAGTDVHDAVALAVIDAVIKATEHPLSDRHRGDLLAEARGGRTGGLTSGGPAIVDAAGRTLAGPDEVGRLLLVMLQPADVAAEDRSVAALPDDATFGSLTAPPEDLTDPATYAAWLVASSPADGPAHAALAAAVDGLPDPGVVLGFIGGHVDGTGKPAAAAALLHREDLNVGQRLLQLLAGRVPEGYRSSMAKTAIPS